MSQNEKKFRIVSVLLSFVVLGILTFALFAPTNAITFDPGNRYQQALQLPDTDPEGIAISTVQWALGLLGLVAVVMIIAGGFMWMTSAGNEARVTKAKEIIKWAVVGMMVIFLSWAIVTFVFTSLEV
ncbi:pilin [Patescibacteria group bacterium]